MSDDVREVILFKRYFDDFFDKQPRKVQEKLHWSINILRTVADIPKNHLKTLSGTDGFWKCGHNLAAISTECFAFLMRERLSY